MDPINAELLSEIATLQDVDVVWLYGSRARDDYTDNSDMDLAVALSLAADLGPEERVETLERLRSKLDNAATVKFSLVDINRAPVPLAYNVITQGVEIAVFNDLRLRAEQQRIWSLWDEYKFEHERQRQSL